MSYSVTIKGFASQKDAKAFYDWFEGSGEQDYGTYCELTDSDQYLTDMKQKVVIKDKNVEFWVKG